MAGALLEPGVLPAAWIGDGPQAAVTIDEVALARVEGEQVWLGVEALQALRGAEEVLLTGVLRTVRVPPLW